MLKFLRRLALDSKQSFYCNYSTLDSHTDTVICHAFAYSSRCRGTQREYSSKPLKHSIVKRILVFNR